MLVDFLPDRTPGLLQLAQMELELEAAPADRSNCARMKTSARSSAIAVAATARPVYAA